MSFLEDLDKLASHIEIACPSVKVVTVAVTEKTARRQLKIKKAEPLVYRGLELKCIGSKRHRNRPEP